MHRASLGGHSGDHRATCVFGPLHRECSAGLRHCASREAHSRLKPAILDPYPDSPIPPSSCPPLLLQVRGWKMTLLQLLAPMLFTLLLLLLDLLPRNPNYNPYNPFPASTCAVADAVPTVVSAAGSQR